MILGVPKETIEGERRVAIAPQSVAALIKGGVDVVVESGAGESAGFPDAAYTGQKARIGSLAEVYAADILACVRVAADAPYKKDQVVIGFSDPLGDKALTQTVAAKGAVLFSMEMVPRITRAQSMDALSSMATIAGYKAVLLAADALPRMFPMLMTAAGTVTAARAFVIGAGVAGLQAIATAKRLGARVEAYDVRPAVKEQIQSLGARFVELPLEALGEEAAQDAGGYAKAQDENFYRRQRELMAKTLAATDVVITTAAIPGKKSPMLITEDAVKGMAPGSVIIDLAAERGGNCELTRANQTIVAHGVTIMGPTNLPATIPYHASQMYSRNILTLVQHLAPRANGADGKPSGAATLVFNMDDEITRDTMMTRGGDVVHARAK
jgi:H+-translocating NAD(P) transhydrogenase subunit alpha